MQVIFDIVRRRTINTSSKGAGGGLSFFGGDPSLAHFDVRLPFQPTTARDKREEARAKRRTEEEALKAAGFKTSTIFQFRTSDEAGKVKAKAAAEELVERVKREAGIEVRAYEGCFL